ncbi:hypothetical protein DL770_002230 [Monosporascus sp. CRB-9-2]|nr:hypothetical protein DL770_002230 [Monosporascus sp. CRB-9-2]
MAPSASASASSHAIPETAIFVTDKCYCRPYLDTDAEAAAGAANDPNIARWMRDIFPHPYRLEDAENWIRIANSRTPTRDFAIIALDGTFVGGLGLTPRTDVESRTYEMGYWVGKKHWGKGIATAAAGGLARWAFATFPDLLRLEARVYERNVGSDIVLRRAGFLKEGLLRQAIFKDGKVLDLAIYGLLRQDVESGIVE